MVMKQAEHIIWPPSRVDDARIVDSSFHAHPVHCNYVVAMSQYGSKHVHLLLPFSTAFDMATLLTIP